MKFFVSLMAVCHLSHEAAAASDCKCVNDWDSMLLGKRNAFIDKPTLAKYEYMGVFVGLNGAYYKPCVCDDVLRAQGQLTVQSKDLYEMTLSTNTTANAERNVTDTLEKLRKPMEDVQVDLRYRIERYYATYSSRAAPGNVFFNVEAVLRGFNDTSQLVAPALSNVTTNESLPFLGPYSLTALSVLRCTGKPPEAPSGFKREWSQETAPPAKAYYKCGDGQYASPHGLGVSTCSHDTKLWSELVPLTCEKGCDKDPPKRPLNTTWSWDNTTRATFTVVNYTCQYGFRSGDGSDANSTCDGNGNWTALPATYFCTEMPCTDDIPQVPSHSYSDFDDQYRAAGTVVTYSCIFGFRSPNETDMQVTCKLGNWTSPTPGWNCVNVHSISLADILKGEMDIPDDELTEEEKQRKLDLASEKYYFWIVTIPSIIGLALAMLLCLCCTRTDSPLYNMCGGYKKNAFGYEDFKKNHRFN